MMPANAQKHDQLGCCLIFSNCIPCVGPCIFWLTLLTANVQNYAVMKTFKKMREREQVAGLAPQPQVMAQSQQGVAMASPQPQVMAQSQQGVAMASPAKFDPETGKPIPKGNKFDPETGKPIPKFDPETGVQNWS